MNRQRLRPLGLGDIFDEGFDLYKRNFVFLLLVAALAVVPLDILLAFAMPRFMPSIFDLFDINALSDRSPIWLVTFLSELILFLSELILFLPLYLLAVAPLVSASAGRYLEQDLQLWQVYLPFLRRLPGLILTLLLAGAALAFSLLGCLVLWLPVAAQLFLTMHAFMIEGKGPGKALGRSSALAGGYGGQIFNCLFLLGLIAWVISLGITLPLAYLVDSALNIAPGGQSLVGGAAGTAQPSQEHIVTWISQGLAHLVLIPFLVCVSTVLYYDLRIRKEGFDIELLADGLHYPPLTALGPHLPPAPVLGPFRMPPPVRPFRQKEQPR